MFFPGQHHARLEHHVLERHLVSVHRMERRRQHGFAHVIATFDGVIAIDQHLRLDDGYDPFRLANGGIARQRFRIGLDA